MMDTENKTIYSMLFKDSSAYLDFFFIACGALLLSVLAHIRIPMWPVPFTMQTLGVILVAFFLGSRKGLLSLLLYLCLGIAGLGVFAHGSGIAAIIGPTGGFLVGFVAMVYVIGKMAEHGLGKTRKGIWLCVLAGEIALYAFGILGLGIFLGSLSEALIYGLIPFIVGDILKAAIAVSFFPYLWPEA